MERVKKAMEKFDQNLRDQNQHPVFSYDIFLNLLLESPHSVIRNVFQVFHDMVKTYVDHGIDEYPDDPESIHFVRYDFNKLFVDGSDHPYFADRLFANRLMDLAESMRRGAQQNKIYIFDGPPGCGKSTFLNNLLMKFEQYARSGEGVRYETFWRLERSALCHSDFQAIRQYRDKVIGLMETTEPADMPPETEDDFHPCIPEGGETPEEGSVYSPDCIEIPCPSHDHPILMIPKHYRRQFFDDLFVNDEFKWKLFTEKEYDWVFKEQPCTICSSLYNALLNRLKSPRRVFDMIYARPYQFNRRLGSGISVFNPGDKPMRQNILGNPMLQNRINEILCDSNEVKYIFSRYAKTNNGIYALMDIKSHNIDRLIELHNIISEGVHKVEDIEENVNSLLMALMNPEDKKNIQEFQSFSDRIEYINIPYVLDLNTEVDIYRNIFGKHIEDGFLPRVLHNFARVIISSRMDTNSNAMLEWIKDPGKYKRYCDANLQLLKMEIFTGHIPSWLGEDDRKRFTSKRRRKIIAEGETEGGKGFSGRDSLKIFNEFYSKYAREDRLINMSALCIFFTKVRQDLKKQIPEGFLESLLDHYDYTILQEVKESIYYYNEEQIERDLKNYMFAVNFEIGSVEKCSYTSDKLEITEEFFKSIENHMLGAAADENQRHSFRKDTQKAYATRTLTQEIMVEGMDITETALFKELHERYVHNLKEKALDPFLENENFRQAIKDYGEESFKSHDRRIREDVSFLMDNLSNKYRYTQLGAKEVCMYVIDSELATKFAA